MRDAFISAPLAQIVFHFIITTSGWQSDESTLVGNVKIRLGSQKYP